MLQRIITSASLLVVALTVVVGCGGSGGSGNNAVVSGKVTLAGKGPLTGGNITFHPAAGADKARTASIKGDGTYTVPDVARGECKVTVETTSLKTLPQAKGTEMPGMGGDTVKYMPIDSKYAKTETSDLSTNIDRAAFTYDVELK